NTVFKFYFQAWLLLALSAAVFVERIFHAPCGLVSLLEIKTDAESHDKPGLPSSDHGVDGATTSQVPVVTADGQGVTEGRANAEIQACPPGTSPWLLKLSSITAVAVALLLMGAALYPAFAIPAKMRDRWIPSAPHTLDGMQFMRHAVQVEQGVRVQLEADYRVIRWLQKNVDSSPTIIETVAEREYLWGNRISIYTGLPAVVGWRWHQVQQRGVMPPGTVEARRADVLQFYNTAVPERALDILKTYDVEYVILTPYERAYMISEGLPKFDVMVQNAWLEIVYQDEASTIYRVIG
ncbi:MAG: hypothetical protein ACP5JG_01340, partial [Anaerolineae bacterium]